MLGQEVQLFITVGLLLRKVAHSGDSLSFAESHMQFFKAGREICLIALEIDFSGPNGLGTDREVSVAHHSCQVNA